MAEFAGQRKESVEVKKRRIILEDGRYLIYYSFGESRDKEGNGQCRPQACEDAEGGK